MLAWHQITPTLKSLFSDLAFSGVMPPFEAQWHDRARSFTHQGTQTDLLLQVTNIRGPGGEDARTLSMRQDAGGNEVLVETLEGDRYITLNVRVESMNHSDELWAWATIERIRTRLDRLTTRERLRGANLAFVRTLAATALPRPRDGRITSAAAMDVLLVGRSCDVDASGALGWIERVEVTGKVQGADGQHLPPSLNTTFTVAPFED